MDQLVVVTHPEPILLQARAIEHDTLPDGVVALGYYLDDHLIARGAVAPEAVDAIRLLLRTPVSIALAATEDEDGNIDGRVCLVLPMEADAGEDEDDEPDEPWKASVPTPPMELEASADDDEEPRLALLPIGNVVRTVHDRRHPDEVEVDVWEMLDNLLHGRAQDATSKAIDDLLDSL
ncbi:MAG TPA: hypothetical protein VFQ38_02860 [Longimicrobiales bacterium]|nr:hypothetical protein [Longimicrobiales bacterium]